MFTVYTEKLDKGMDIHNQAHTGIVTLLSNPWIHNNRELVAISKTALIHLPITLDTDMLESNTLPSIVSCRETMGNHTRHLATAKDKGL